MHVSNKCMLLLLTMSSYIHVESPKGMQFALKYEILKVLYQCAHNSSIHAYKGAFLSPCITDSETDAEHHNRLCIWIYINSHAVLKMHGKHR